MATTVYTNRITLSASIGAVRTDNPKTLTDVESLSKTLAYSDGNGADQADRIFSTQQTIAASGTYTFDINEADDPFGQDADIAYVQAILIENCSTNNVTSVVFKKAASNGMGTFWNTGTGDIIIPKGGIFLLGGTIDDIYAVTAATACNLSITNLDGVNAADVKIFVIGHSA